MEADLFPAPSVRRRVARNLVTLRSVDSTNSLLRRVLEVAWRDGTAPPEIVVRALEQTAGRGRLGRDWVSTAGLGIYVSVLSVQPSAALAVLPLAVGIGLAGALGAMGCRVRLKWPNDLWVEGRKLGGILIESVRRADGQAVVVIGFGVNHGHVESQLPIAAATSLRLHLEPLPPLGEVSDALVAAVLEELDDLADVDRIRRRYAELSAHRPGDPLRCRLGETELEGRFLGFDERGHLRLETAGSVRRLAAGEVLE